MSTAPATTAAAADTPRLKLYDVAREYAALLDRIAEAGGELDAEAEAELETLAGHLIAKVDATAAFIVERKAAAAAALAEADRLKALATTRQNQAEALSRYLLRQLEAAGERTVETGRFKVWIQPHSSVSVEWPGPVETCPFEFTRTKVEVDKAAALKAVRAGEPLPEGFEVRESVTSHIRIR